MGGGHPGEGAGEISRGAQGHRLIPVLLRLLCAQDMDLVPLLLQENYLNHRPQLAGELLPLAYCVRHAHNASRVAIAPRRIPAWRPPP